MIDLLFAVALTVVDGDTVKLKGERLRIENIDAPETKRPRAQCDYEIQLGLKSAGALRGILKEGEPHIIWSGRRDPYRRPLIRIEVNRRDVGERLIAMGLAQPWTGSKARWCD